jgi:small subunit ribosomal protein S16
MLAIRFQRQGRKNTAFFRVVLTESSRPPKSGFLKILGWYNPHTKETSLNKEEISKWLDQGAQASNSVSRLLQNNKIEHKNAKFVQDAPKKSKKSAKKEGKQVSAKEETVEEIKEEQVTKNETSEEKTEAPADTEEKETAEVTEDTTKEEN